MSGGYPLDSRSTETRPLPGRLAHFGTTPLIRTGSSTTDPESDGVRSPGACDLSKVHAEFSSDSLIDTDFRSRRRMV
jgi:hypothetical protein